MSNPWIIDCLNGKENGYFVNIGANDGKSADWSYRLEKYFGWTGICVEPAPESCNNLFSKLKRRRENSICVNVAIYSSNTFVDFLVHGGNDDCSGIVNEEFHGQEIEKQKHNYPIIKLKAITPLQLLEQYDAPDTIDFLSVDTEGSEYEILKVFPFDKYKVFTIASEHNAHTKRKVDIDKQHSIQSLLFKNGFKLYNGKMPISDDYFVHKDIEYD